MLPLGTIHALHLRARPQNRLRAMLPSGNDFRLRATLPLGMIQCFLHPGEAQKPPPSYACFVDLFPPPHEDPFGE
ncbi:unnamed protein product [Linum trigynum]|uniref:Uncharacterized protein n=1 Tax=Linum trigynum TaxID=586398 RepID=A0AAV2E3M9_9ROSI